MNQRPLHVLIVSTTLSRGGAQRVTSTLLEHFDRTKIQPSLCLLRHDIGFPMPDDVTVHHLGYRGTLDFMTAAGRLANLIAREQPDLVLSNVNATNLLTGWALRDPALTLPWVARIGNSPRLHDRGLRGWAAKRVYGRANAVVANSRGLAGEVAECYPVLRDRVEVIGNPTDFEAIDRLAGEPSPIRRPAQGSVVVAVGRLFPQKRYDVMLRAFRRIREAVEAELWVCGDGPERRRLERLATNLGVANHVRWLGFVENPHAVLRQADLFLMTSDHEGLPNALIEAQGLGLPAVATRCPHGPSEIVNDEATGLLVPVGDVHGIGTAVAGLLGDPDRRRAMGAAARERARRIFDQASLVKSWENLVVSTSRRSFRVAL
jgi:glycosyltransferase involved in cell wall biosynthesis